jgi:hypothetical protein
MAMIRHQAELLEALQKDKDGDWDGAHTIVQRYDTMEACWVHAYLHREEGVLWNARYWYNMAGKPFPEINLEEEWDLLYNYVSSAD